MGSKTKAARAPRRAEVPDFISKSEMAEKLRCSVDAITDWVRDGHYPPPSLCPGPGRQISLWRLDHFLAYLESGEWPDEAFGWRDKARSGRRRRGATRS